MSVNITSMLQFWRTFGLTQLQRELDHTATELATRQDNSDVSRRKLVEQMKTFKRVSTEEIRKSVAPLLKSFQLEIDSLTKRSKSCETDFLTLYKKLIELPDPVAALEQAESFQRKNQRLNDIETENTKLRETLAEYNKEFAEVKNQEVTIKNLRERIKELERDSSSRTQKVIEEKHEALKKEFAEREKVLHDTQFQAATKLSEAEQKVSMLQSALDESQSELFNLKTKYDEENAAKQAEAELILSDLDRANQMYELSCKEVETLKDQLQEQSNTKAVSVSTIDQSIEVLSRNSLEAELAMKEKEVSQLVEDIQHMQSSMAKLRESSAEIIVKLEEEQNDKEKECNELKAKLKEQSDYMELKRELHILKSTEFSGGTNDPKTLEMLLLEKNRGLQSENTGLRAENAQLKEFSNTLEQKVALAESTCLETQELNRKLEFDLMMIQAPASVARSDADGSPSPPSGMSGELVADAIKNTTGPVNTDSSLLMIVSSQRERFRQRNNELEADNYNNQQTIQHLQGEVDSIRADNVKLYEKIKYLQSYPTSSSTKVSMEDVTANRYSSQYEETLDPFTSFNRKEKQRKYMNLTPPEKVTLGLGKVILSSKIARNIFFFYMLFMHCLLYIVLYKYAYADDCKRHIAEMCYEKFGPQMMPGNAAVGANVKQ
uniref:protein CASP n=1 Tax=Ciona intestinalis TaxID=7719 RepID=UPI0000521F9A|nr:protein CASP [Ciona intestinalis]|eukprot:XP_026695660.1 protein CASP [Ciona intestinalis]